MIYLATTFFYRRCKSCVITVPLEKLALLFTTRGSTSACRQTRENLNDLFFFTVSFKTSAGLLCRYMVCCIGACKRTERKIYSSILRTGTVRLSTRLFSLHS